MLYRDALMLVVDKPAGLAVHAEAARPGRRARETLTDDLDALRFGLPRRPELAHRLDRDTSGCLVLGRHRAALARLGRLFATNAVEKTYWAIVAGGPDGTAGTIELPLASRSTDPRDGRMGVDPGGKPALTRWQVLGRSAGGRPDLTWLALNPVTGRTHQLRVHCAASGWPIVGDGMYGGPTRANGLHLHAQAVSIPLYPRKPPIRVEASAPDRMRTALSSCGWDAQKPSDPNR